MQFISGIKDVINLYDYFILDVWGVIHDGSVAYPGAIDVMRFLKKQNKKVCFLSNAPRRSKKVAIILERFGVTPDLYDFIITSGEANYLDLEKNQNNNFTRLGKKYFYIGPDKDLDLLDGLNYIRVKNAAEADFAINTGFNDYDSTLEEKLPQAIEAKKYDLPMICVNPDLIVIKQDGNEMICAGALAREYEKIGGKVIYYGKPFDAVYKIVCEIFNNPQTNKMVAIGDGLETDIKGANDFGIDNILVTGGILTNSLGISYNQAADKSKLEEICSKYKLFPKFVIPSFKL